MFAFRLGDRTVDLRAATVTDEAGAVASLTPIEARLLGYLARRPGVVVGRDELLVEVWEYRPGVATRTIDNTSARLRTKIEPDPSAPRFLHAVYGRGLRLDEVAPAWLDGAPTTRFVGRDGALTELGRRLRDERVVTVVGPGGAGKSRLVAELIPRLGLEVARVTCEAIHTGDELDAAVLQALNLSGAQASDLGRWLARGPLVLALDACEGCVEAVAERVSGWLAAAPRLRVLATSRLPLGLPGEQQLPIGPLAPPDGAALFVDRARARSPELALDADAVDAIVAAVDGLPLAIELAAARVGLLGAAQLRTLLEAPLDVLGAADGPSMARVLERSWVLLSPAHRRLLRELAVFEGPFTLDDAVGVTGLDRATALDGIDALVAQSLLRIVGERFTPFAVVRARARREPPPPDDDLAVRQARWFARLGEPATLEQARSDKALRQRIRAAVPDLRAGFDAADGRDVELAARCLVGLAWVAVDIGPAGPTLARIHRFDAAAASPAIRFRLAYLSAHLYLVEMDHQGAIDALTEALPLATEPDDRVLARCLLATNRRNLGDLDGTLRELALAEPDAGRPGLARAKWLQASAVYGRDPVRSEVQIDEAVRLARRFGDARLEVATALFGAGRRFLRDPDRRAAARLYDRLRAVAIDDELTGRPRAFVAYQYGAFLANRGDLDAAEQELEESAELCGRWGLVGGPLMSARTALARVWGLQGRFDDAIDLVEPYLTVGDAFGAALAHLAVAEIEERRGDLAAARDAIRLARRPARDGSWFHVASEVADLGAVLDGDASGLARPDPGSPSAVADARRHALASVIAAEHGTLADAEAAYERAEQALGALDLLPASDGLYWLRRAERAVAIRSGKLVPRFG